MEFPRVAPGMRGDTGLGRVEERNGEWGDGGDLLWWGEAPERPLEVHQRISLITIDVRCCAVAPAEPIPTQATQENWVHAMSAVPTNGGSRSEPHTGTGSATPMTRQVTPTE
jgi:hypothetical protein